MKITKEDVEWYFNRETEEDPYGDDGEGDYERLYWRNVKEDEKLEPRQVFH